MQQPIPRPYGPLIAECAKRGISRTVAFNLVRMGMLETACIGRRRYVYLDSLDTLPQRFNAAQAAYKS